MALVWATADRIPRMKETNTSSEQSHSLKKKSLMIRVSPSKSEILIYSSLLLTKSSKSEKLELHHRSP
jgi:hypothetical protein